MEGECRQQLGSGLMAGHFSALRWTAGAEEFLFGFCIDKQSYFSFLFLDL